VKWDAVLSDMFRVEFGVRRRSVLSPFLFAIYVDDLAKSCSPFDGLYIVLYADDILLLTSSVCQLQRLPRIREQKLAAIDIVVNPSKSCCVGIGPRINADCTPVCMLSGDVMGGRNEVPRSVYCTFTCVQVLS